MGRLNCGKSGSNSTLVSPSIDLRERGRKTIGSGKDFDEEWRIQRDGWRGLSPQAEEIAFNKFKSRPLTVGN